MVGPAYLDYIQQYPRDRGTEYYRPGFSIAGKPHPIDLLAGVPTSVPPEIEALQTFLPPMAPSVQASEGKGWPQLEQKGMPLFLPTQN